MKILCSRHSLAGAVRRSAYDYLAESAGQVNMKLQADSTNIDCVLQK